MSIHYSLLVGNPFINAYLNSDLFGKLIFISLIVASLVSWTLIIYKCWLTWKVKKSSRHFQSLFEKHQLDPLALSVDQTVEQINPFLNLYAILKKQVMDLLRKNRHYSVTITPQEQASYLSSADVSLVESHLATGASAQNQILENHLFILSMIVSLGPFLGLLGTVWGILTTFGELQNHAAADNHAVLGGISLALATTVLGLLDAIPALIGYSYLKSTARSFATEMECFCNEMLASVELHYRKVDLR